MAKRDRINGRRHSRCRGWPQVRSAQRPTGVDPQRARIKDGGVARARAQAGDVPFLYSLKRRGDARPFPFGLGGCGSRNAFTALTVSTQLQCGRSYCARIYRYLCPIDESEMRPSQRMSELQTAAKRSLQNLLATITESGSNAVAS
jgi:hypothetical protein